jgi:hypothetical protein
MHLDLSKLKMEWIQVPLKIFDCSKNDLKEINGEFFEMNKHSLTSLNLSSNSFQRVPLGIVGLSKLQTLKVCS